MNQQIASYFADYYIDALAIRSQTKKHDSKNNQMNLINASDWMGANTMYNLAGDADASSQLQACIILIFIMDSKYSNCAMISTWIYGKDTYARCAT